MTLIPNNDRVPVQKLGDPLLVGETYPNGKSLFKVLRDRKSTRLNSSHRL